MSYGDTRDALGSLYVNGIPVDAAIYMQPIAISVSYDNQMPFATAGARTVYKGTPVKSATVQFVMSPAQYDKFTAQIFPVIREPSVGKKPVGVDVSGHPYLTTANMRVVATTSLSVPYWDLEKWRGMWVVDWTFQDFNPPAQLSPRIIDPLLPREAQETPAEKRANEIKRISDENTRLTNFLNR